MRPEVEAVARVLWERDWSLPWSQATEDRRDEYVMVAARALAAAARAKATGKVDTS